MDYKSAVEFIHGIGMTGPKPGLARITALLELMGNPQDELEFIHVAGTNGKGSTCSMLSHVLQRAGYTAGLNISPFILDFRERFQVNNEWILEEELAEITSYCKVFWDKLAAEGDAPSEFELIVAIAFEFFRRRQCDIVVLEVGMGGRLDATNVITSPLVSVITSISLDHVESLGATIAEIAREKAGIIKEGGTTVCYPRQEMDALAVIMEECAKKNNLLILPNGVEIHTKDIHGTIATIDQLTMHIPLAGQHQVWNATTVVWVCRILQRKGIMISNSDIIKGIEGTIFPSRLEILSEAPLTILDGAHNVSGAKALAETLDTMKGQKIHAVIGIMQDKDVDGFLEIIATRCASIVTTSLPEMPRFIDPENLAKKAAIYCDTVSVERLPKAAYEKALSTCGSDDILLLCGSLYLAGELRTLFPEA